MAKERRHRERGERMKLRQERGHGGRGGLSAGLGGSGNDETTYSASDSRTKSSYSSHSFSATLASGQDVEGGREADTVKLTSMTSERARDLPEPEADLQKQKFGNVFTEDKEDDDSAWGPNGSRATLMFSGGVLVVIVLGLVLFLVNSCRTEEPKSMRENRRQDANIKDEEMGDEGWDDDWGTCENSNETEESGLLTTSGRRGSVNDGSRGSSFGSEGEKGTFSIKGVPAMPVKPSSVRDGPERKSPTGGSSRSRGLSATPSPSGKDVDLFEAVGVQAMPTFDTKKALLGSQRPMRSPFRNGMRMTTSLI